MALEPNKRPKRTSLSKEEVANVIAYKKRRDLIKKIKLKKSTSYKIQNLFNVFCFFIYCELLFCFVFPSNYSKHYSASTKVHYGNEYNEAGELMISKIDLIDVNHIEYDLIVEDYIKPPEKFISFLVAKDYLLQKKITAQLSTIESNYRLFSASPVLLLCTLGILICLIVYLNNLNESAYSLTALCFLNLLIFLSIISL